MVLPRAGQGFGQLFVKGGLEGFGDDFLAKLVQVNEFAVSDWVNVQNHWAQYAFVAGFLTFVDAGVQMGGSAGLYNKVGGCFLRFACASAAVDAQAWALCADSAQHFSECGAAHVSVSI